MKSEKMRQEKLRMRFSQNTSETIHQGIQNKKCLYKKGEVADTKHVELATKLEIEQKQNYKPVQSNGDREIEKQDTILNEHDHSNYSDIMEYISNYLVSQCKTVSTMERTSCLCQNRGAWSSIIYFDFSYFTTFSIAKLFNSIFISIYY